ncbi:MAG: hypothetical protein HYZ36_06735, partial [Pedosphaera parvula]|nr:hypothetical protein [Pedosphaera parvula]
MNNRCCCCGLNFKAAVYAVAILGTFLITAFLVREMQKYTAAAAINQKRIDERLAAKKEMQAAAVKELTAYAWKDQAKGIVIIPIEQAKALVLKEWQDPAAGRAKL